MRDIDNTGSGLSQLRLEEIFQIADRVTVLKDGAWQGTYAVAETDSEQLISRMVGRDVALHQRQADAGPEKSSVMLEVRGLNDAVEFRHTRPFLRDISFNVRSGDIVVLAGLAGAGRTELALSLFGARPRASGEIFIAGKPVSIRSPAEAIPLGIHTPVWLLLLLAVAAHYALHHTRFFRQYYYIGCNPRAAHLSGINVERMQMLAFTLMGTIAGFAGIVYASRIATASSTLGDGKELGAITAVILGGASLAGGKGTIVGALIGVFFMALMQNVLIILRVPSEWQSIALGAVLVLAVALDSVMSRKRS